MAATQDIPLVAETLAELAPGEVEAIRARRGDRPAYFGGDGAALEAAYRKRPSAEWLEALWAADVPVLPAQRLGEIFKDAQARANGYVVSVDDLEWGRTLQAGTPFHTDPPSRVQSPATELGAHTDLVLSTPRPPVRLEPRDAPVAAPLAGTKVLDLGNFLAGPFATMLMADLGADVVKLEATRGDAMRPVSRVFAGCQRGKRGVALDLKNAESRPALEALVRWADVVHHNLREPAARKLGIDYDTLRPLNPNLVYCHTSSYGPRGERADWPGFDQLFQAYSGWEVEGGGVENPPMWHRMGMMDHQNALASLVATLLALWHRQRTGQGQKVCASILGAATLTASETLIFSDGSIAPYERLDHAQSGIAPGYAIYPVADGWVAVAAVWRGALESLVKLAGADSPDALRQGLANHRAAHLVEELDRLGVPAEVVRLDQGDAFLDRTANRETGLVASYAHRDWGQLEQVGAFWQLGDLPLCLDRAPPALGEHTRQVLGELGFAAEELERLAACGALVG
jgi:crotonobetainyl-CoA:carnitine CoA-transferase CaiB-like acyl-CoA transferase